MKPLTLLLILLSLPLRAEEVLNVSAVISLDMENDNFGGFSSLVVAPDGGSFFATSDRGYFFLADIVRGNGNIVGLSSLMLTPIVDTKGQPLTGLHTDAEGLAFGPNGEIYMSFEGNHRIMVQNRIVDLPEFLPKHPEFRTLINNSGLEALAVDALGVVFAIPERSGDYEAPFPVYRLLDDGWNRDWSLPRRGDYLVTGADIFNGQLYILERDLVGLRGFSSRIRRFDIGEGLTGEQTLLTTAAGTYDNLEGISVWQNEAGEVRVLLISDDNFRFFQKNQLVEMVLEASN